MQRAKMPMIAKGRYWPSYIVHLCACRDFNVSNGEKDVCKEESDEAGDCRFLSFDRNLRRSR